MQNEHALSSELFAGVAMKTCAAFNLHELESVLLLKNFLFYLALILPCKKDFVKRTIGRNHYHCSGCNHVLRRKCYFEEHLQNQHATFF